MTITISPQTEALLKEQAGRLGEDADTLADTLLQSVLEEAARDFEEAVEGIRRGLEAGAAGDEMPFEEYVTQVREKRRRRGASQAVAETA